MRSNILKAMVLLLSLGLTACLSAGEEGQKVTADGVSKAEHQELQGKYNDLNNSLSARVAVLESYGIQNSVKKAELPNCGVHQKTKYVSATDSFTCESIVLNKAAVSGLQADLDSKASSADLTTLTSSLGSFAHKNSLVAGDLPLASVSSSGAVGTTDQTFAGVKTFNDGLVANGAIVGNAAAEETSTNFDFTSKNLLYTSQDCGAFTLSGLRDGGNYTLVIEGTNSSLCSFTVSSGGFTVKMQPGHVNTVSGTHTVYSFLVSGSYVYVFQVTGF